MIFLDSNVPMYLIGADHPNKERTRTLLERFVVEGVPLVTDAEVLQEILHRYTAIDRRDAVPAAFEALLGLVEEVFPIEREDALQARDLILGSSRRSARDALHVAVMRRRGAQRIFSFDRGFEGLPGIERIPAD